MLSNKTSRKFSLGQVVATPESLAAIEDAGQKPADFLDQHACGAWGELSDDDRQLNEQAITDGSRILSAYRTSKGTKIWIISEAADDDGNRAATTLLLPEQY